MSISKTCTVKEGAALFGADETAGDYTADDLIEKCGYPQKNHE